MSKVIHIANGDNTAELLKKSGLGGEIVVWREMLCEGPIHKDIGSDKFWKNRYKFFKSEFGVERLEYFDKTIKEIIQLEDVSEVSEVVLWFEYDLFCQVNLLAACSYLLKSFRKNIYYSLVCVGKEKGEKKLQSLNNYTPNQYHNLYENKIKLTKNNLIFADECWNVYFENDINKLKSYNFTSVKFQYLAIAIKEYLKRFPLENGLNEIENKILSLISENKYTEIQIVRALLIWQENSTIYGFGDLQYFWFLKKLNNFYEIKNEIYRLNNIGLSKV